MTVRTIADEPATERCFICKMIDVVLSGTGTPPGSGSGGGCLLEL